jgi:ribosomal protein L37AE/L43A
MSADDAPRHLDFCDECVGETLHYRDETDGMWTCASCGRWSALEPICSTVLVGLTPGFEG